MHGLSTIVRLNAAARKTAEAQKAAQQTTGQQPVVKAQDQQQKQK